MLLLQRLLGLIKFAVGIVLLQAVTALIFYTALQTDIHSTWPWFVAVAASCGLLATFWFEAIAGGVRVQALARLQQRHAREREKIRLQAERERARMEVKRTKSKGQAGAKLRIGIALGGALGVGVAMMLAQFVTLGLLTIATAGGAALGYGVRVRQERRLRARELSAGLPAGTHVPLVAARVEPFAERPPALEDRGRNETRASETRAAAAQ